MDLGPLSQSIDTSDTVNATVLAFPDSSDFPFHTNTGILSYSITSAT